MSTVPPQPISPTPDDSWRAPLLATLQSCGVERPPKSRLAFLAVYYIVFLIIVGIARTIGYAVDQATPPGFGPLATAIELLFDIFVLGRVRSKFKLRNAQAHAYSAEQLLSKPNSPRPVFYLRSFQFDDRLARISFLQLLFGGILDQKTPEQKMVAGFNKVGPVIAIGRPGEELPTLGAARFYVTHELWQQKVSEVASACRFVVWATGTTEGLRWEISHLIENLPPEKLILFAHPHTLKLPAEQREAEWRSFVQSLGNHFPVPLPTRLGDFRYFFFGPDWKPYAVAPPKQSIFADLFSIFSPQQRAQEVLIAIKTGQLSPDGYAIPAPEIAQSAPPPRTFASLIGARPAFQWLHLLIFALALFVSHNLSRYSHFDTYARAWTLRSLTDIIPFTLLEALAAFVCFRFISKNANAALLMGALCWFFDIVLRLFHTASSYDPSSILKVALNALPLRVFFVFLFYWILAESSERLRRAWLGFALAPFFVSVLGTIYTIIFDRTIHDLLHYLLFQLFSILSFAVIFSLSLYLHPNPPAPQTAR
jgi:hypothetical protein